MDSNGIALVVWHDTTTGPWGADQEILYANYSTSTGQWSNVTCISDDDTRWNTDVSDSASIAVDSNDNAHVAWFDFTDGPWGTDEEILYASYSTSTGQWSNATCVSDDDTKWNTDTSRYPSIAIDSNDDIHISWHDSTAGPWGAGGSDWEILYMKITYPNPSGGGEGGGGGGDTDPLVPFGDFYALYMVLGIIGLVVFVKRRNKLRIN